MKLGIIVGHLPKKISVTCSLFLRKGGAILCQVMDEIQKHSVDLVQGGLEIQCLLIFSSKKRDFLDKLQKLLAFIIEKVEEMVKSETSKDKEIAADNETAVDICLTIPDFQMMVW